MAHNEKMFIDWDFGHRSRWCGIDSWKVARTLQENKSGHTEYYDGSLIKSSCDLLVENGILFEKSGLYYFAIPKKETFEPKFPEKYDTLIVEYFDSKWSVSRNKVIDRFIRKSRWVYDRIDQERDKYMLRFLLKGEEIYAIPYTDTGYPESAVKIMSDEILREYNRK